ncbi:MAG: phosphopantetheine-binding protein [Ruminococcus sp.]|jgi:acyl carrier protein|nr:phosphopantetheine-binding protein [Ruminococcus sp.]
MSNYPEKFTDILNRVNESILEYEGKNLVEDGVISSLDVMTLIAECEEGFEIEFDPDDIYPENFESPAALWALLNKYADEQNVKLI